MKLSDNPATLFLFPFFLLLTVMLSALSLFDRHPEWKPVPHRDGADLSEVESGQRFRAKGPDR